MEVLNYESNISTRLYTHLQQKGQINPNTVESMFIALVTNAEYLNFSPEASQKIIELHQKYMEVMAPAISARQALANARRALTNISKKVADTPDNADLIAKQQEAQNNVSAKTAEFLSLSDNLTSILSELNSELLDVIAKYNSVNPDNVFVFEEKPIIVKQVKKTHTIRQRRTINVPITELHPTPVAPEKPDIIVDDFDVVATPVDDDDSESAIAPNILDDTHLTVTPEIDVVPSIVDEPVVVDETHETTTDDNSSIVIEPTTSVTETPVETATPTEDVASVDTETESAPIDEAKDSASTAKEDDKEKEETKPEKKKGPAIAGSVGYVVAAFSIALLMAGITGIFGIILSVFAVAGSLTAVTGHLMGTIEYVEWKDLKKPKKEKTTEKKGFLSKIKDFLISKIARPTKIKETRTTKTPTATKPKKIRTKKPKAVSTETRLEPIVEDYVPTATETRDTITASSLDEKPVLVTSFDIITEHIPTIVSNNTLSTEEKDVAITNLVHTHMPTDFDISTIPEDQRELGQACLDVYLTQNALNQAQAELEVAQQDYDATVLSGDIDEATLVIERKNEEIVQLQAKLLEKTKTIRTIIENRETSIELDVVEAPVDETAHPVVPSISDSATPSKKTSTTTEIDRTM